MVSESQRAINLMGHLLTTKIVHREHPYLIVNNSSNPLHWTAAQAQKTITSLRDLVETVHRTLEGRPISKAFSNSYALAYLKQLQPQHLRTLVYPLNLLVRIVLYFYISCALLKHLNLPQLETFLQWKRQHKGAIQSMEVKAQFTW